MVRPRSIQDIILSVALLGTFAALFFGFHKSEIGCAYVVIVGSLVLVATDINGLRRTRASNDLTSVMRVVAHAVRVVGLICLESSILCVKQFHLPELSSSLLWIGVVVSVAGFIPLSVFEKRLRFVGR